jgi:DNA-3-methyladenine glycosylase I
MQDARVIRNRKKLESISSNAARMLELEREHGSFKKYLAAQGDFEAKVKSLKKNFKFMGETGSYIFLYVVGEQVPPHDEWSASRGRG